MKNCKLFLVSLFFIYAYSYKLNYTRGGKDGEHNKVTLKGSCYHVMLSLTIPTDERIELQKRLQVVWIIKFNPRSFLTETRNQIPLSENSFNCRQGFDWNSELWRDRCSAAPILDYSLRITSSDDGRYSDFWHHIICN